MKKTWKRPQLKVLKRHKPEEMVLTGCKHNAILFSGPGENNTSCGNLNCLGYCEADTSS